MQQVAIITSITGSATVLRGGETVELQQGAALFAGDTLETGTGAALEMRFEDGAVIELGQQTQVEVRDFIFDATGKEDPSFVFHMMEGMVRSVSGEVVKQNPEAFKLTSPLGTVGIRGTETVHIISPETEVHSVTGLGKGHTVVIATPDGRSLVIESAMEAVKIQSGSHDPLERFSITQDIVEEYIRLLQVKGALIANGKGGFVIADDAALQSLGLTAPAKGAAFILAGSESTLIEEESGRLVIDAQLLLPEEVQFLYAATPGNDYILGTNGPDFLNGLEGDDVLHTLSGNDTVYGGYGNDSIFRSVMMTAGTFLYGDEPVSVAGVNGGDDSIVVNGGMSGGLIAGDADELSNANGGADTIVLHGEVSGGDIYGDAQIITGHAGGDDSISAQSLSGGVVYGDAETMTNAAGGADSITLSGSVSGGMLAGDGNAMNGGSGGNDSITAQNMSAGAVYGDAETMTNTVGGADSITLSGSVSGGMLAGDGKTMNGGSGGNDSIAAQNMSAGAVYGDAETMTNAVGGADSITFSGTMTGGELYGDAKNLHGGSGGDDNMRVTILAGGELYGDAHTMTGGSVGGNDVLFLSTMTGGTVYGDAYSTMGGTALAGGWNDTITVTSMSAGSLYGDGALGSVGGADVMTVTTMIGNGSVIIDGGAGDDSISVTTMDYAGSVTLGGGDGNDTVKVDSITNNGIVTLSGGAGNDNVSVTMLNHTGFVSFAGGDGNDTLKVETISSSGTVILNGGDGNDNISVTTLNQTGAVTFIGGDGNDTLKVETISGGGDVILDGGGGNDSIAVETLNSSGTVRLFGGDGTNIVTVKELSGAGSLTITGGLGRDEITLHNVDLSGGKTVSIDGGSGYNILSLGDGVDHVDLAGNTIASLGSDSNTFSGGSLNLLNITSFSAGNGNDTLRIDDTFLAKTITGAGGDDSLHITGGGAGVRIYGGLGVDTITADAASGFEGQLAGYGESLRGFDASSDSIMVTKLLAGGVVSGDALISFSDGKNAQENVINGVAGGDSITITQMTGGTVYGDAKELRITEGGTVTAGNDTITIGEFAGGAIYLDGERGSTDAGVAGGANKLVIEKVTGDAGVIYTGTGADTIVFKALDSNQTVKIVDFDANGKTQLHFEGVGWSAFSFTLGGNVDDVRNETVTFANGSNTLTILLEGVKGTLDVSDYTLV